MLLKKTDALHAFEDHSFAILLSLAGSAKGQELDQVLTHVDDQHEPEKAFRLG